MRYSARTYAEALVAALNGKSPAEQKKTARRFALLLQKNRDWPRRTAIIRAAEKEYRRVSGRTHIRVESPESLSGDAKKEIKNMFGRGAFLETAAVPEHLAGIRILIDNEILIDATARRRMDRLFPKK